MGSAYKDVAPEAAYQVAAVRITCPHATCQAVFTGPNGTTLIVRRNGLRAGEVRPCQDCGRPSRLPPIVDELGD